MDIKINARKLHNLSLSDNVMVEEVNICPICHHAIKPVALSAVLIGESDGKFSGLSIQNLCNYCKQAFLSYYSIETTRLTNASFQYASSFQYSAPNCFEKEDFSSMITDTSPSFEIIYNQALEAEGRRLDQIAGIGYRKALEFLIKDFLISENPDDKEKIETLELAKCINNYIKDENLRIAALRAAWLGNDQAHYVQRFTEKDINDFKRLIRLSVHWIEMVLETRETGAIEPRK